MPRKRSYDRPPERLPEGYLEIWHALADIERGARSRQHLAQHLGVSTHTLQRLLVSGDVPEFHQGSGARLTRSWARTLTRLAIQLGRNPRDWICSVGIAWEPEIEAVVEQVRRQLRRQVRHRQGRVPDRPERRRRRSLAPAPAASSAPLLVGILSPSPWQPSGPETAIGFLHRYARRLFDALALRNGVRWVALDEPGLSRRLMGLSADLDAAVGWALRPSDLVRGLGQVRIPGLRITLCALAARPAERPIAGFWSDLLRRSPAEAPRWIVPLGHAARDFLLGACGLPRDSLIEAPSASPADLAERLLVEAGASAARPVILVADAERCRAAGDQLGRRPGFSRRMVAELLEPGGEPFPAWPVGIVLHRRRRELLQAVRACTREELFGRSAPHTARLYAELVATQLRAAPSGATDPAGLHARDRLPRRHPWMSRRFQDAFCDHLLADPAAPADVAASGVDASGDVPGQGVRLETVRAMLSRDWDRALGRWVARHGGAETAPIVTAGRRPPGQEHHPYCLSCAVPLEDPHNRGPSSRYCRYCSDPQGRLRPRREVEGILADWFRRWQGDLDPQEALRRARRYMSALPAWNRN